MVALELALNYPEMVEALILVDTASQWPAVGDWISQLKTQGFEEAMRYNMFLAFNDDFSASPAGSMFLEYLAKERVPNLDPNSIMGMLEAIGKSNLTARLSEIRARTLILVGEKDAMIPPTYSEEIHKHIAGSKYVVIKDSKHCLQQNRPSEFNQVVLDFLREIEC
jgi:pimeloyl-ACP methyl ester carboxylesterase